MKYIIYTDGSCKGNGKKEAIGGWAYYILSEDKTEYAYDSNGESNTTNNRMELTALAEALEYINNMGIKPLECEIYTDSAYIHNCYIQKWYKKWLYNGWVSSSKESVKNQDLWIRIIPFFENNNFKFYKVKGHNGNKYNELVDKMAVEAAESIKEE